LKVGSTFATVCQVSTIQLKELRNNVSDVLRRAQAGEEFTITVSGRPVARLGPIYAEAWVPAARVQDIWDLPVDTEFARDLEAFGAELRDPWSES
jgi:prevent-host-death family protein